MPDLDKVERTLPPAWRAPYKLVKGHHPLEEVARAVLKVLSGTLRREGGVPRLGELAQVIQQRDAGLLDDRRLSSVAFMLEQRMVTRTERLAVVALLRPEVSGPASVLPWTAGCATGRGAPVTDGGEHPLLAATRLPHRETLHQPPGGHRLREQSDVDFATPPGQVGETAGQEALRGRPESAVILSFSEEEHRRVTGPTAVGAISW